MEEDCGHDRVARPDEQHYGYIDLMGCWLPVQYAIEYNHMRWIPSMPSRCAC